MNDREELRKVKIIVSDSYKYRRIRENENISPDYKNGYFHRWEEVKGYEDSFVRAIVELEDGTLLKLTDFDNGGMIFVESFEEFKTGITTADLK